MWAKGLELELVATQCTFQSDLLTLIIITLNIYSPGNITHMQYYMHELFQQRCRVCLATTVVGVFIKRS